ncbi:MAG: DUF2510 domain-containing protein [Microbacteriaceae bacterium]|nr:DUF2510 domain-containing protein [Microbacteriaceae bacterium]
MSPSDEAPPPAAWYDDPSTPGQARWWDGAEWTEHVRFVPLGSIPPSASRHDSAAKAGAAARELRELAAEIIERGDAGR